MADERQWRELLDLARSCSAQARWSTSADVAAQFRTMAREYFERAKALNPGLTEQDLEHPIGHTEC
jgi:hypothetical protein